MNLYVTVEYMLYFLNMCVTANICPSIKSQLMWKTEIKLFYISCALIWR